MNTDKLSSDVEKIIEKIRNLKYKYDDKELEIDGEGYKHDAIVMLEEWLTNVQYDAENTDIENESED